MFLYALYFLSLVLSVTLKYIFFIYIWKQLRKNSHSLRWIHPVFIVHTFFKKELNSNYTNCKVLLIHPDSAISYPTSKASIWPPFFHADTFHLSLFYISHSKLIANGPITQQCLRCQPLPEWGFAHPWPSKCMSIPTYYYWPWPTLKKLRVQ